MKNRTTYSEKELDSILDGGFKNFEIFSNWFISKTRFSNIGATYKWSRSDHPWGRFSFDIENPETGEAEFGGQQWDSILNYLAVTLLQTRRQSAATS